MIKLDPANGKSIIWLASYPRSGNTWLRAFLASLYEVMRSPASTSFDFDKLARFGFWDNATALYQKHVRGPIELADPKLIASLRPKVMREIVSMARGALFVKTHNAKVVDRGTPFIDPDITAGAVYIVRNPLDVVVSIADFRHITIDRAIEDLGTRGFGQNTGRKGVYWVCDTWTANVRSWAEPENPQVLVVRYEDMRENPETTFGKIATHLGFRASQEQLRRAMEFSSFSALRGLEASKGFAEKPPTAGQFFRSGQAGQWQAMLTADQVRRVVNDHGKRMQRFGYLP